MPKRKLTAARKAQLTAWQRAGALARERGRVNKSNNANRVISFPGPPGKAAAAAAKYTPPGRGGRRHKMGGKAYQKKTGQSFVMAPEAAAILAGHTGFRDQTLAEMSHQGPAKVPRIRREWRFKHQSAAVLHAKEVFKATRKDVHPKIVPSQVSGSGTGLQGWARYK